MCCKSTKKLKNIKKYRAENAEFCSLPAFLYLCSDFQGMRRVEYIVPIDAMRGSLCERQVLEYAESNNPAWYAPDGLQPALNYKPILVVAKRDKQRYYMVRTKSSARVDNSSKMSWAVFGGACALFGGINGSTSIKNQLMNIYRAASPNVKFRRWCFNALRPMLQNKALSCTFGSGASAVTLLNPWQNSGSSTVNVDADIYNKFVNFLS